MGSLVRLENDRFRDGLTRVRGSTCCGLDGAIDQEPCRESPSVDTAGNSQGPPFQVLSEFPYTSIERPHLQVVGGVPWSGIERARSQRGHFRPLVQKTVRPAMYRDGTASRIA